MIAIMFGMVGMFAVSVWCAILGVRWLGDSIPQWGAITVFTVLSLLLNAKVFGDLESCIGPVVFLVLGLVAQGVTRYAAAVPASYTISFSS
jgi:hypothetical protein